MKKIIHQFVLFIALNFSAALALNVNAAEVDLSQAQKQCSNITPQQRQMAKAAGYDVDSLCASLSEMSQNQALSQPKNIKPRPTSESTRDGSMKEVEEVDEVEEVEEGFADGADSANLNESKENQNVEKKELKQFGYEIFAGVPTTFAPATDIPVPVDYIIGPGDNIRVQLYGKTSNQFELVVQRDGVVNFPELGPISLAGLTYQEMKTLLNERVQQQMIGVSISITMGELRSIQVFVLGEAYRAGSYTVSSLSTMTNALLSSGGITKVGSLRNIQLKRRGKIVARLDLYDLLLKGDTSDDVRLLPGDVLFVPPIGKVASIAGEVKRPAIYELKDEETAAELLKLAGGLLPNAFPDAANIERINPTGDKTIISLNLANKAGGEEAVKNGDLLKVPSVLDRMENIVILSGHVQRPGAYQWRKGMRVSDLVPDIKSLLGNPDVDYAILMRERKPLRDIEVLHVDLRSIMANKGSAKDYLLQSRDELVVLDKETPREELLAELIAQLKLQASGNNLAKVVSVRGDVQFPGEYPLTIHMNVKDLVAAAGGLKEAAYLNGAELTRQDFSDSERVGIDHIEVNLGNELNGQANRLLEAKDKLAIFKTPEYQENQTISLVGEVLLPGDYEFRRGETLSQVINRAGGFSSMAHIGAAVFTRVDLKIQEAKQLQDLRDRMREDIAASELEDAAAGKGGAVKDAEKLLDALSETEAVGRLVISLEDIVTGKTDDIQLKDGDMLIVPTYRQEVSVLGEVQHSTSHIFNDGWTLDDYLEKSGGLTNRADDERIYVVKADGSVFLPNQSGWLSHQKEMLSPGDTIVVPLDTDRIKSLTLWTNVSQIVYQLALGAAAISRL